MSTETIPRKRYPIKDYATQKDLADFKSDILETIASTGNSIVREWEIDDPLARITKWSNGRYDMAVCGLTQGSAITIDTFDLLGIYIDVKRALCVAGGTSISLLYTKFQFIASGSTVFISFYEKDLEGKTYYAPETLTGSGNGHAIIGNWTLTEPRKVKITVVASYASHSNGSSATHVVSPEGVDDVVVKGGRGGTVTWSSSGELPAGTRIYTSTYDSKGAGYSNYKTTVELSETIV